MTIYVPDLVSIHFDRHAVWQACVVRDRDGMLVCAGPVKLIRQWLDRHGYKWIVGSNGWWRRN